MARGGGWCAASCLAGALMAAAPAVAAQIEELSVSHEDGHYRVHMRVWLAADAVRSYRVFSDPILLPQINPAVKRAEPRDAGRALYTEVRVCAGLFCKTLRQTQTMRYAARPDGGHIEAQVQPEISDFKAGFAAWDFTAEQARTRMTFDAEMEPDFWIPPLIGPYLVERSLREEAERTSAGIERLANALAQPPGPPP